MEIKHVLVNMKPRISVVTREYPNESIVVVRTVPVLVTDYSISTKLIPAP